MAQYLFDLIRDYYFWGGLGFFIGCFFSVPNLTKNKCPFPVAIIMIVAGIYGGLLGTRILHVLLTAPHLFIRNLPMALTFWHGGLSWQGGIILGYFTIFIISRIFKQPFWESTGSIAPGYALAHSISRIGCLIQGCCHGIPTQLPWRIYSSELNTYVHPTQIYSIMGEFASFLILQLLWRKKDNRKYLLPLYGILFGLHRFIAEFFRGDPPGPELISGLRIYQVISILIFSLSLCVLIILKNKKTGTKICPVIIICTALPFLFLHPVSEKKISTIRKGANLYLVITRKMFSEHLSQWKEKREKDGYQVFIGEWETTPTDAEIKTWIKEQTRNSKNSCGYILLVGDCASSEEQDTGWHIPSFAQSIAIQGETLENISDAPYGDIDQDGCPDIPVGRFPVRNAKQLKILISKIFDYEKAKLKASWFRLILWSGAKGYHPEIDKMTMNIAMNILPGWMDRFIISGNISSPFSGYPPEQPTIFLKEISDPAFLSIIISHGSFRSVTPCEYEGKDIYLNNEMVDNLESDKSLGTLIMLGCNSGQFNISEPSDQSLAEKFIRHPGGPICVIASSGPADPLTNYLFSICGVEVLENHPGTTGNLLLAIQRELYRKGNKTLVEIAQEFPDARNIINAMPESEKASLIVPKLLQIQILGYNLLGDPAILLRQPLPMEISINLSGKNDITAKGNAPSEVKDLVVDLVRPEQKKDTLIALDSREERLRMFNKINKRPAVLVKKKLSNEPFTLKLSLPSNFSLKEDYLRFLFFGEKKSFFYIYRLQDFNDSQE